MRMRRRGGKKSRCVKCERAGLHLAWVEGPAAVQGFCTPGSKVNVVRTLHKVWTNKRDIYGPVSRSDSVSYKSMTQIGQV